MADALGMSETRGLVAMGEAAAARNSKSSLFADK